jgi:TRAP-type C4-dicarboxylate transport system permease large subunit
VAIVLFVPLLMPVARAMGIDELQFSMVTILTLTIGLITPPVGCACSSAAGSGTFPSGDWCARWRRSWSPRWPW